MSDIPEMSDFRGSRRPGSVIASLVSSIFAQASETPHAPESRNPACALPPSSAPRIWNYSFLRMRARNQRTRPAPAHMRVARQALQQDVSYASQLWPTAFVNTSSKIIIAPPFRMAQFWKKSALNLSSSGQSRSIPGQRWSMLTGVGPNLAEFGPALTKCGQHLEDTPRVGRTWRNSGARVGRQTSGQV